MKGIPTIKNKLFIPPKYITNNSFRININTLFDILMIRITLIPYEPITTARIRII